MAVPNRHRRLHVMLPGSLLDEIDERVGKGRRSGFIREAVAEKPGHLHALKLSEQPSLPRGDRENLDRDTRESTPE